MKIVENPKEYQKVIEYWDKGDGKTNSLLRKTVDFPSSDINISIRDFRVIIPVGESVILADIIAEDLVRRFPHLIMKDYTEPTPKKTPRQSSKKVKGVSKVVDRKKKNAKK